MTAISPKRWCEMRPRPVISDHIPYAEHVHEPLRNQTARMRKSFLASPDLTLDDFDTLVGTGLSGAIIVPGLARVLKKKWVLIRKPDDDSHHGSDFVGDLGERWLFVDDFISMGYTLDRVLGVIAHRQAWKPDAQRSKWVGAYLYQRHNVKTSADILSEYRMLAHRYNAHGWVRPDKDREAHPQGTQLTFDRDLLYPAVPERIVLDSMEELEDAMFKRMITGSSEPLPRIGRVAKIPVLSNDGLIRIENAEPVDRFSDPDVPDISDPLVTPFRWIEESSD